MSSTVPLPIVSLEASQSKLDLYDCFVFNLILDIELLTDRSRALVEDLLYEGCLLSVDLDEIEPLWRIMVLLK